MKKLCIILGLTLAAWGAWTLAHGVQGLHPHALPVSDLDTAPPPGRWLELTGRLLTDERVIWPLEGDRGTYVPLVADSWQPGQPISVFVRAWESNTGEPGRLLEHKEPAVTGLSDARGLPADVRAWFERNDLQPEAQALVLDYRADPGDALFFGTVALLTGVLLVGVALVGRTAWKRSPPGS